MTNEDKIPEALAAQQAVERCIAAGRASIAAGLAHEAALKEAEQAVTAWSVAVGLEKTEGLIPMHTQAATDRSNQIAEHHRDRQQPKE